MANETVVRVTADASGYAAAMEKAKRSAQDFLATQDAAAARTAAAQKAIEEATANGSQASTRAVNAFIQTLAKQADTAGKTRAEMLQMKAAALGVSDSAQSYIDKIAQASKHTEEFNLKTAGARRELLVLAHEASQGNWKNFGGSMLVLGERTDALSHVFSAAGLQVGMLVAGLAALAIAAIKGAEETKQFNAALVLTSNYAGLTAQSLHEMEQRVAGTSGGSLGKATEVLLDLAQSGRYTSQEMEGLSNVIIRTAKISGQSLEDVSKEYSKLSEDPAKWAYEHNQSMHFMDTATYQHIQALQEAGEKHKAVQAVIDAATKQVADSSIKNLSTAAQAWKNLSAGVQEFWANLKQGLSSGPTLQNRIDTLMGERRDIQGNSLAAGRVAQIDRQVALLQEQQRLEQRTAESQARIARINQDGIEAAKRVETVREQVMTNAQRREKELAQLAKDRSAILAGGGTFSDADYEKLVAGINEKYKDKAGHKPKAYQDDAATRFLQQLRDQDAAIRSQLESSDKLTAAEKQQAEFLQKISDLKGKSILTAEQKSLLAAQDQIKAQLAQNVADEKKLQLKQEIQKLEERSAQINSQIASYQNSQREQYGRQLDAFGMGSEAQKNAEAVKSIYKEYQRMQVELDKATPKDLIGGSDYLAEQEKIRAGLQQSLQDYTNYYEALKARQADWTNGATQAIANYSDAARNMAAQTESVVSGFAKGMEDALTKFVSTGKMNFKSLSDFIIVEINRMAIKAMEAKLFEMVGSFIGGSLDMGGAGSFGGAASAVSGASSSMATPLAGDYFGTAGSVSMGAGTGVTGIFGARADGGPVTGGGPYLVGERGPELFVPNSSGNIVPNHALRTTDGGSGGGNGSGVQQTFNMDIRVPPLTGHQTAAQMGSGIARQLGMAIRRNG
ncbi:phage tail tape measure protein [Cupriavidus sp. BIC8F]|uniref:phage tail tape measure protein n=1 Tax=Cupriavidus sp. BIC8F TaxID=3079014 RepID=UPI00291711A8|nr:phage tail tape measure protein [Cupriavidus sp. BIC8F]